MFWRSEKLSQSLKEGLNRVQAILQQEPKYIIEYLITWQFIMLSATLMPEMEDFMLRLSSRNEIIDLNKEKKIAKRGFNRMTT